jgi:hypothetical protein
MRDAGIRQVELASIVGSFELVKLHAEHPLRALAEHLATRRAVQRYHGRFGYQAHNGSASLVRCSQYYMAAT